MSEMQPTAGKSRWRCLQCAHRKTPREKGRLGPCPLRREFSGIYERIHSFVRRAQDNVLTMGTGLNSLLLVPESFTHLRTLTSTNNIFILRVAGNNRVNFYKSTLESTEMPKAVGDSFAMKHFHAISGSYELEFGLPSIAASY